MKPIFFQKVFFTSEKSSRRATVLLIPVCILELEVQWHCVSIFHLRKEAFEKIGFIKACIKTCIEHVLKPHETTKLKDVGLEKESAGDFATIKMNFSK